LPVWRDFSFISHTAFTLTQHAAPGGLDIFSFDSAREDSVTLTTSLLLPELMHGFSYYGSLIHSGPILTAISSNKPDPAAPPSLLDLFSASPFVPDFNSRIHVLEVLIWDSVGHSTGGGLTAGQLTMVVHGNELLKAVERVKQLASLGQETIPWNEWGPQNTRIFDSRLNQGWWRYVFGMRMIAPRLPNWSDQLTLYDFSSRATALKREGKRDEGTKWDGPEELCQTVVSEAVFRPIARRKMFKERIVTRLPYKELTRYGIHHNAYMIDDEVIVAVDTDGVTSMDAVVGYTF